MKRIKIEVTGISPLLQHRFPVDDTEPTAKIKNKAANSGDVESCLYRLPDGTIYQPGIHFIACMKKAGAKFKIPGQGKATYKNLIGSGAVLIDPEAIPHKNQAWEIDARAIVNPSTKGRNIRKRPCFKNWVLTFHLEYDEDEISCSDIKAILDYAGRRVGIGDFRPEKGGPFGRFLVSEFKEV